MSDNQIARRIAVTGATGMIGRALSAALEARGDTVVPFSRRELPGGVRWDPQHGPLEPAGLEGISGVVHLAGENIAAHRWSAARKRELVDSRVTPTARLVEAMGQLASPPTVLVSASAIGYYGDRGDQLLNESADPGQGFLADLALRWEGAAQQATSLGVRVVNPRFGVILDAREGALPRMITPIRFGVGGKLGNGRQWVSWITLRDVVGVILAALDSPALSGPVNAVVPDPIRNDDFTRAMGRALHRPVFFTAPTPMLRLILGEVADALLLCSARVIPEVLQRSGFIWQDPELEPALRGLLHGPSKPAPPGGPSR